MINGGCGTNRGNALGEMTLRQWICRPGRVVDREESLHIFRQILDFVDVAHVQGVILRNIRPSCFILSPFNRVAFIDSAGTGSSSDRSSERSTGRASVPHRPRDVRHNGYSPMLDPFQSTNSDDSRLRVDDGRQDAARLRQTTLAFNMDNSRTGEGRVVADFFRSWVGSNNARWGQDWSGSLGSELSADAAATVADVDGRFEALKESAIRGSSQEPPEKDSPFRGERFPQKKSLLREQTWYSCPEEHIEATGSFAADMFCLGVLFFELFCTFCTEAERVRVMSHLRHRILPPRLLSECPKEAAFCLWLLHPEPNSRPKTREVLECELLSEAGEALAERQAAISVEERAAESDLLLNFLLRMQHEKQDSVLKLNQDVTRLTSDIEEVERRRYALKQRGRPLSITESRDGFARASTGSRGHRLIGFDVQGDRKSSVLGKRAREEGNFYEFKSEDGRFSDVPGKKSGDLSSKSARLMNNFTALEKVYFSMRWKVGPPGMESTKVSPPNVSKVGASSSAGGVGSNLLTNCKRGRGSSDDWLGCFFDSLCKYARYSRFEVKATLRHGDLLNTANMVCSLSFDRDEEYFATAGVCKRIQIFECDAVLNEHVDIHYPVAEMTSRSKLSSVCWNSYIKSHIASSDYDGVVQLWDATTRKPIMEYCEHEKRAWSVDFSRADPTKLASGSDDGCVKLWSINQETSINTIKTRANVCCVQFPPDSSHLLAFGSADYKIYCYDLRATKMPLCVLGSHSKAVSYVKFVDPVTLVSASTDNTLQLWDLTQASSSHSAKNARALVYTGHLNEKNFVGLSVSDGYIACGSEKNSVFAYHKSLPMPLASHKFGCTDPITGQETEDDGGQFVSSVCWRGKSQTLVAANSMGNIKVLEMV